MAFLQSLTKQRHFIAPIAGAVTVAAAIVLAQIDPVFSVMLGSLVWGGTALVLTPASRSRRIKATEGTGFDADFVTGELEKADSLIQRIRAMHGGMRTSPIAGSIGRICYSAELIIADLGRNPRDYRRLRKPLVQYLPHVETIVERYNYMETGLAIDEQTRSRTQEMLRDLEKVFMEYNRRMMKDEAYDLDARIALLESAIDAEGIDGVGLTRRRDRPGRARSR